MRATALETNRRVLVVDDSPATRYATSRVLRAAGFEVIETESGEDALERVGEHVDLVVLDVNLPGIDGFETCRRMRARPDLAGLPIIHLSASFVDDQDRESGFDAGADQYLTHPVEPVVLVGAINSCLRMRRAEIDRRSVEDERERLLHSERAAREEAENANQLKDQFLAMLSHELRNPLNAVVGWAQVLLRRYDDAELQKGLGIILNAAHAQAQLISDLLEVSRITSGKLNLEMEHVRVAQVVANAIEAIESDARAKDITTTCDLPSANIVVEADPVRLQQVIWNLLSNSVKFTPPGGRIDVAVRAGADRQVHISVADTGAGIERNVLPHVFERFRQADTSVRRRHGGLGLGLAIVHSLVEAQGGSVSADSPGLGHGATFVVTLPQSDGEPTAVPGDSKLPLVLDALRGARILVVEDDGPSCEMVAALFADRGAQVEQASSVTEALQRLSSFEPELLVSDVGMPDRDGYDLLRTVRRAGHGAGGMPAIALTAFAGAVDRDLALAAGFQRHVAKPLRADELMTVAAELLRRRRSPESAAGQ